MNGSCDVVGWWRGKTYAINTWGGGLRQHLIQDIQPSPPPLLSAPFGHTFSLSRSHLFQGPITCLPLRDISYSSHFSVYLSMALNWVILLFIFINPDMFFFSPSPRPFHPIFNKHYVITWMSFDVFSKFCFLNEIPNLPDGFRDRYPAFFMLATVFECDWGWKTRCTWLQLYADFLKIIFFLFSLSDENEWGNDFAFLGLEDSMLLIS